jgi:serine/threonine-protein kinase
VFALALGVLSVAIRRLRERVEELAELGQYQLDSPLGAGGMGTVYLARHALLRRPTAVKVLRPEQASDDLVRRFEQEVQQTARLSHPNTIEIYDYGRTPERVFYYAMEYADGLTLDRLVALEGRLPAGRAAHLLRQLCGSLAEAHARGLVHRDVKPQNVLVCERGGLSDFVKVLDSAWSRRPPRRSRPAPPRTARRRRDHARAHARHAALRAAERLRGQTEASPRGDVYALGATAFRMLTGRDVFSGATSASCARTSSRSRRRG